MKPWKIAVYGREQLHKGDQYGAVRSKSSAARNSYPPQRYIRERLRKDYDVTDMTLKQRAIALTHVDAALDKGKGAKENSNDRSLKTKPNQA